MATGTSGFVANDLSATQWERVESLVRALLDRPVRTPVEFEAWIIDRSDLEAACSETQENLYIAMTCDTEDAGAQDAYTHFIETITPKMRERFFELDRRQANLAMSIRLDPARYGVLERSVEADVSIYRAENVPLLTELDKSAQAYQKLIGAMSVLFDGKEHPLPRMAPYQESTDRMVRESAWRAVADRRRRDRETIDALYDEQVHTRDRVARNAGHADFASYMFARLKRFDYTREDCRRFHDAIERHVVPLLRREHAKRREVMKLDSLRPWDLAVDPLGRSPLRPFKDGGELQRKCVAAFKKLDPRLAGMLASLGDGTNTKGPANGECLDLDSRKGKAPGGYQSMRERTHKPFIFMNAAGLHNDVATLAHEAGHAFHSMVCVDEPIVAYRSAPIEFCEVASMSAELLSMPHWGGPDGFYPSESDHARAKRQQMMRSIDILPWIAQIDAFQLWVYEHPTHSREERTKAWLTLDVRFAGGTDWRGLEMYREMSWQRQLHLFTVPLYYVEYGIAQLGALQLWTIAMERGEKPAIEGYLRGLSLGGSRPLPQLFEASGLRFDLGASMVERVASRVERELAKLPL